MSNKTEIICSYAKSVHGFLLHELNAVICGLALQKI